jgi:hypothetical protein
MSYTLDKLAYDLLDHMDGKPSGRDVFVQVGDHFYLMRGRPEDKGRYTVLQAVEVQVPAELVSEPSDTLNIPENHKTL